MATLKTRLTGTLTFVTDQEDFTEPMTIDSVNFRVDFDDSRTKADATRFELEPIGPFAVDSPLGSVDVMLEVTRAARGKGSFDKASGEIVIPIVLDFEFTLATFGLPVPGGTAQLDIELTTGQAAASGPFQPQGKALSQGTPNRCLLVGAAQFSGGRLDGRHCQVVIDGTIAPDPFA